MKAQQQQQEKVFCGLPVAEMLIMNKDHVQKALSPSSSASPTLTDAPPACIQIALMEDQVKACRDRGIEAVMLNSNVTPKDAASIYARLCPSLSSLGFPHAPDSERPPQIKLLCKYSLAVGTSLAREPNAESHAERTRFDRCNAGGCDRRPTASVLEKAVRSQAAFALCD